MKKRKGGCCGCLLGLLALAAALFFAGRKWAPQQLAALEHWSQVQVVARVPQAARFFPSATPSPMATPAVTASATPGPVATPASASPSPAPSVAPEPRGFDETTPTPTFTDQRVGSGASATIGRTVVVRYASGSPAAPPQFMLGASEVAPELDAGVRGMKVGGQRQIGEWQVELVQVL